LFHSRGSAPDEGFRPGILPYQTSFALALLMDLNGFWGMGHTLVTLLIVLRLADLMLIAEFGPRLAFEALKHNHGFGFGIPFPA
jgi:hypothetical protein